MSGYFPLLAGIAVTAVMGAFIIWDARRDRKFMAQQEAERKAYNDKIAEEVIKVEAQRARMLAEHRAREETAAFLRRRAQEAYDDAMRDRRRTVINEMARSRVGQSVPSTRLRLITPTPAPAPRRLEEEARRADTSDDGGGFAAGVIAGITLSGRDEPAETNTFTSGGGGDMGGGGATGDWADTAPSSPTESSSTND